MREFLLALMNFVAIMGVLGTTALSLVLAIDGDVFGSVLVMGCSVVLGCVSVLKYWVYSRD